MLSKLIGFLFNTVSEDDSYPVTDALADPINRDAPWGELNPQHPVLMLDIDGVLHPGDIETLEFRPQLYELLDLIPELQVVFSTNWQHSAHHDWLLEQFRPAYRHRFCGVTGESMECAIARQREIERFARTHCLRCFVAVDDKPSLFEPNCPWLFVTNRYKGLSGGAHLELAQFINAAMNRAV